MKVSRVLPQAVVTLALVGNAAAVTLFVLYRRALRRKL